MRVVCMWHLFANRELIIRLLFCRAVKPMNVTMSPHSTLQRAFARIDKKRVQLSDNQLVEDHLGDKV